MVQISDAARDRIREILDANNGKYLRLYVSGIG